MIKLKRLEQSGIIWKNAILVEICSNFFFFSMILFFKKILLQKNSYHNFFINIYKENRKKIEKREKFQQFLTKNSFFYHFVLFQSF